MSWLGIHAWSGAWLFLLVPPLVAFYFLKLKRPRMEVPSLVLWRQVMADQRVNSPFQRFRRNLLLWLQLAALLLLCFAGLQPFIHASSDRAEYLPVLIDTSASMAAVDAPRGTSRLDEAKARVGELIDNLPPYQRISLIAFHGNARRLTDFTDNRRILRDALNKLQPADVPSRLDDALRMTQALARTQPVKHAVLYTDGNVPPNVDFELPFELKVQTLPPGGSNAGITALNARRTGADRWDVFVRLEASAMASDARGSVELLKDGQPVAQDNVTIDAGGSSRLVFRVDTAKASALEVRFKSAGFDSLASDNAAYLDLPESRPLRVRITPDLATYKHALRDRTDVEVHADKDPGPATDWDLIITDTTKGAEEATVALFVGVVPDDIANVITVKGGAAAVIDWDRTAPLLQHVLLSDVTIAAQPVYETGAQESDLEALGYRVLAHGQSGPLMLEKSSGARLSYYILFHTDVSTLPYRVGFPILVANAVDIALHSASLSEVRGLTTGVLPVRAEAPSTTYVVKGPGGPDTTMTTGPDGALSGISAQYAGRYTITGDGRSETVGVSLLDSGETQLGAAEKIQFRETSVTATAATLDRDRPLWSVLAGIGFCVLLVEWWYFQRRPGVATA